MDYSSLQKTKFERIDVNQMLRQIVEFLQSQKRFRNFSLEFQPDGEILEAEMDQGLLEQVLYNFLNNAADASGESQVKKIVVRTQRLPGEIIRIIVKDHGQGIEAANIDKLFREKFTTKETGHGIGLVVCKNIIDRHHGRITVDSVLGQGTEFRIDLPISHEITEKTKRAVSAV
jgi:signal transduction histidine kinase